MNKEEIIKRYGKNDGYDLDRYEQAIMMASLTDNPISICFKGLINLENKGLINLVNV